MSMKLEVNGVQYENFTAASCEVRLDALSSSFSFEAVAADGVALPFKGGESCKVLVNDNVVLTGFIEIVRVSYDSGDHTITVEGRDKTGDLLDSSIKNISDLRAPITLKQIIEKVISDIGLDIKVVQEVDIEPFSAAQDIIAPEPGDNAFSFIEKYSRKRQVLLTSNGEGDIVIASGSATVGAGSIQHVIGAEDNNVISSSFSYDTTGRFNVYRMISQLNPIALNKAGETRLASLVSQGSGVSDPDIRIGRQMVLVTETPFSISENEARAKWEANIRKARGLVYAVTVPGYGVDSSDPFSDLWEINKLYPVIDNYLGKTENMLSNSVTFTFDTDGGEQTSLSFVDEKAYSLELSKPKTSSTANLVLAE